MPPVVEVCDVESEEVDDAGTNVSLGLSAMKIERKAFAHLVPIFWLVFLKR